MSALICCNLNLFLPYYLVFILQFAFVVFLVYWRWQSKCHCRRILSGTYFVLVLHCNLSLTVGQWVCRAASKQSWHQPCFHLCQSVNMHHSSFDWIMGSCWQHCKSFSPLCLLLSHTPQTVQVWSFPICEFAFCNNTCVACHATIY